MHNKAAAFPLWRDIVEFLDSYNCCSTRTLQQVSMYEYKWVNNGYEICKYCVKLYSPFLGVRARYFQELLNTGAYTLILHSPIKRNGCIVIKSVRNIKTWRVRKLISWFVEYNSRPGIYQAWLAVTSRKDYRRRQIIHVHRIKRVKCTFYKDIGFVYFCKRLHTVLFLSSLHWIWQMPTVWLSQPFCIVQIVLMYTCI